jgi:hypothetical protein
MASERRCRVPLAEMSGFAGRNGTQSSTTSPDADPRPVTIPRFTVELSKMIRHCRTASERSPWSSAATAVGAWFHTCRAANQIVPLGLDPRSNNS